MKKILFGVILGLGLFGASSCTKTHKDLPIGNLYGMWDKIYVSSNGVVGTISNSGEIWEFRSQEDSVIFYDHNGQNLGSYVFHRVSSDSVFITNPLKPLYSNNFKYKITNDTLISIGIRTSNSGTQFGDTSIFKKL